MYKYLFLATISAFPTVALAQADEQVEDQAYVGAEVASTVAADDDARDTITVTANGLGTAIANTGQAVTLIDRAEIDAVQGADFTRVLRRAPGVTITRNGPIGSVTGVNVRGAGAEQLLVLIDGVRVADAASPGGGFDFGNLLTGSVGKIDLLRGSNSTIWGSDAVGGVLDVSTRAETGAAASVEYGARETITASAAAGYSGKGYYVGLNSSWFKTDGFSAAANGTEDDGFEQWTVGGSAFVDLAPNLEVFANARYAHGDLDIDGFAPPTYTFGDTLETQETDQYSGAVGLAWYGTDMTLRAAYSLSDTERSNRDPAGGETFASDGHTQAVSLRGEYRLLGGLVAAFGGEHEWSNFETSYDERHKTNTTGAYGQLGWVMGNLAAHVGARYEDHQRFGGEASFGGDVSYGFGDGWRVRASVGEGFKAPTLYQLYSDYGTETLQPERSTSYDLGIERGERGGEFYFALTGFRRDSKQLIGFDSTTFTYQNIGKARAQGFELELGARPAETLATGVAYSFIDTENRTADDVNFGNDLARRPRHALTLYADWTSPLAGLVLGGDLRMVGDSFDNTANTTRLDGFVVTDLRASLPLGDVVELFGRIENVFDVEYQTAAGYASPGRGGFVGIRARM